MNLAVLSMISFGLLILLNLLCVLLLLNLSQCPVLPKDCENKSTIAPKMLTVIESIISSTTNPKTQQNIFNFQSKLAFEEIDLSIGRWDNQRIYQMHDFALVGDSFSQSSVNSMVCLATQSSVERLHSLPQVANQWGGPISLAVFVAGKEEFLILQYYVTYIRMCFDFVRNNVTFHIASPNTNQPQDNYPTMDKLKYRFDCQNPEQTLRRLLRIRSTDMIKWRIRNAYPQNHMRNLARKGCQTPYVFLTDIDIIPSGNIVPHLNAFLSTVKNCARCAYVIPTFEIDVRVKFPTSKADLIRLYKKGLARPFHEKVFIYNQYATNFTSWLLNAQDDDKVKVSHTVTNFEFLYEPFYIAHDIVPAHDERFLGYGFTRNSQVYEMYIAGYTFYVLSPIFTCHWGLQQKKSRPSWRDHQNNMNRQRFEIFKNEIFVRYKKGGLLNKSTKPIKKGS